MKTIKLSLKEFENLIETVVKEILNENDGNDIFNTLYDYETLDDLIKDLGYKNKNDLYQNGGNWESSFLDYLKENYWQCCETKLQTDIFYKAFDILPLSQKEKEKIVNEKWNIEWYDLKEKLSELFYTDDDYEVYDVLNEMYQKLETKEKYNFLFDFFNMRGESLFITKNDHLIVTVPQ